MKILCIGKRVAFLVIIMLGLISGFSIYASQGQQIKPDKDLQENSSLPKNESGETYGTGYDMNSKYKDPELIKARGINGEVGYIRMSEVDGEEPKTPEEAVAQNELNDENRYVNVYEVDGKTIIDQFQVSSAEESDEDEIFEGNIFEDELFEDIESD